MDVEYAERYRISDDSSEITEITFLKCPECGKASHIEDWPEREIHCEDCGSHPGTECPQCGEEFDLIFEYKVLAVETDQ